MRTAQNHSGAAFQTCRGGEPGQGKYTEAINELNKARKSSGENTQTISLTGYAWALSGNRAQALAILKELKTLATQRYVPSYNIAMVCNGLGEDDEAFTWLELAYEKQEVLLSAFITVEPLWNRLRAYPRFVHILKRLNHERLSRERE